MTRKTLTWRLAALLAVLTLAAACGGGGGGEGGGTEGAGGGEGSDTVTLLHGIKGDTEQAALQQAIDAFEESSGKTVEVEFSPNFETVIVTRVQGGNAPDVALYPQPGLLERLKDDATPLSETGIDMGTLDEELVPGMVEAGTFDDEAYGTVVKLGIKSLLFYAKDDMEKNNYEVPETWDDMVSTSEKMAGDLGGEAGKAPWCIGIESQDATGWVATDWIEDIMLRLHGPEVYDQWVAGEVKFDSPEVREAFEYLEEIWMDEELVVGGTTAILQTPFGSSAAPMFDDPAGCYFHRQAGFITGEFPEDAKLGTDYDLAYLPPIKDEKPALFAGDVAAIHTDNASAGEFLQFLVSAEGQEAWMSHEGAGSLSVRKDFDTSKYPAEALAKQGEIFAQADFARFDASDLMPGEVGAGAFWKETVAWISGSQDLDTTLKNIDSAWPE